MATCEMECNCSYVSGGDWQVQFLGKLPQTQLMLTNRHKILFGEQEDWKPYMTKVATDVKIRIPSGHVAFIGQQLTTVSCSGLSVAVGVIDSGYRGVLILVVHNDGLRPHIPPYGLSIRVTVFKLREMETIPQYIYKIDREDQFVVDSVTEVCRIDEADAQFTRFDGKLLTEQELKTVVDPNRGLCSLLLKTPTHLRASNPWDETIYRLPLPTKAFKEMLGYTNTVLNGQTKSCGGFVVRRIGRSELELFITLKYNGPAENLSVGETLKIDFAHKAPVLILHPLESVCVTKRAEDAGYDIKTPASFTMEPGDVRRIVINQKVKIRSETVAVIMGRSSMNAMGLVVAPCIWAHGQFMSFYIYNRSSNTHDIRDGQRIAQLIFLHENLASFGEMSCDYALPFPSVTGLERGSLIGIQDSATWMPVGIIEVDSERGEQGFGSTGKFERKDF
ncbi:deoxyuridine triphosphatase [Testudinid alphaherpesvirus 3]|uniref:dUTP diphosphatase n=1 Tax=Testudinid alphaherpesvirus 3 TaxID=2560801 RepID=A0A0K1R1Z4_9ALPH|nr:deoxyuridine triphosphatase [Testudinid alphaherpesvirus 3]AIU39251.1 deoxyuridine triphosphatase [Testudinid alphaherpesvirus 3]AIU39361.1 deoxyuridine triphosphatase [Testudinid alphaherpesvirus 3]AKI81637.1 deoxyuridine triphosphatase [Testudinid alphaherpesvirus 3]AKI81741.1 deoxyuridine triphosphatase [Testudinid alphaherpesvirus 3]AKV40721.1 UL50 deoxyuridine triphosphatase protein [Testudinid alphaherpesvirus 3]